jgi:RNA-splicing ligase RtcB
MAKIIYTERDIDDLAQRGVKEIAVTEDVYLTDVARERAEKLGIALRAVTAPVAASAAAPASAPRENVEQVVSQVKADVIAKLGPGVDAALIERIVRRVVGQLQ